MAWDSQYTLAIPNEPPITFTLCNGCNGRSVAFCLSDEATRQAILTNSPSIKRILDYALANIEEIAIIRDLWGWPDISGIKQGTAEEIEEDIGKLEMASVSRFATEEEKESALSILPELKQILDDIRTAPERKALTKKRRLQFRKDQPMRKLQLIERDGGGCARCGSTNDITVDHIIPISRGGPDDLDNLQLLCRRCNGIKRDTI